MLLSNAELTIRLVLSLVLGGIIGLERETTNKPAGFRTHILVCMGSAVIMLTSIFIFSQFQGKTNVDPTRIPAQVVSGIGFLGAGTIIREGASVKGLTTAASLWAVSAIGLAIGAGFYYGATLATFMMLLTLVTFNKLDQLILKKRFLQMLFVVIDDSPGQLGKIGSCLGEMNISIRNIKMESLDENRLMITLMIPKINRLEFEEIKQKLQEIGGVYEVNTEFD
ncbi:MULTISPECIES: MgtC/SapB family protein [Tepidanaerobacter]|uniref:MgtC/SapB family protein n=1 Tax=Tepidanaerobacter TaxID=499228 RepID=UPI000A839918|nr:MULTISPECIES: MgtC/SapB family protein [Tepidanaerobacter]GLI18726.1 magnesium transporter MgtC [Tepidanaerobacter syntrophicus]GLI50801.1 magnesium transporter MgtC [Tepidanaerobacter syntrophicus]HHV83679.1 MgtC/SapB family protein [Tepidanaerobacter syntrophicus]